MFICVCICLVLLIIGFPSLILIYKVSFSKILFYVYVATLALGLQPKQEGLQGCGPRGSLGVTSHTPGSVGKCKGVNPHTPKVTLTLGDGVTVDSQNFIERFQGPKLNGF